MKKNKLNLLNILIFTFLYSCSVPKFYDEIKEMQDNNKYEIKKKQ
jgi:amino acid permease